MTCHYMLTSNSLGVLIPQLTADLEESFKEKSCLCFSIAAPMTLVTPVGFILKHWIQPGAKTAEGLPFDQQRRLPREWWDPYGSKPCRTGALVSNGVRLHKKDFTGSNPKFW